MNNVALLFNGVWSHYVFATAPKYRDIYQLVYVHDLTDARLATMRALVIPFQSNQDDIAERKGVIYRFLAAGNTVFVEGDSRPDWLDAQWEDRPVNNYWWVERPNNPPVADHQYSSIHYSVACSRAAPAGTHTWPTPESLPKLALCNAAAMVKSSPGKPTSTADACLQQPWMG